MQLRTLRFVFLLALVLTVPAFPARNVNVGEASSPSRAVAPVDAEVLATADPGFAFHDAAFSAAGELIVSVGAASRVPCDSYIALINPDGLVSRFAEPCVDQPSSLAFDPGTDDLLFFAETAGYWDQVYTVPPAGTAADVNLFASGFIVPLDLAFGPDGNLYVADVYSGTIYKINPDSTVAEFASGFSVDTSGYPTRTGNWLGIAFDPTGALFVADGNAGTIYRVSPDGVVSPFASGFAYPTGMVISPSGDLLVADGLTGTVYSVAPDGIASPFFSGLRYPLSLALGPDGSLHVLERETDQSGAATRITRIAPIAPLIEQWSTQTTLVETLLSREAVLNDVDVTGNLQGSLQFTNFDTVSIASGPFAGKGFSKGEWHATLDGLPYDGEWTGVVVTRTDEGTIYLKGRVSGGIVAAVEGQLGETVPGSGVYDLYEATWKFGRLGARAVSGILNLNGTVTYEGETDLPDTELYVLQAYFAGALTGDYSGPLSTVVTHVRVMNDAPHAGEGFSIVSFASDHGSGTGWTYDQVMEPGTVKLKGVFGSPLFGVASATLEENYAPRVLYVTVGRVDLGLAPSPDLKVQSWGPRRVSPGEVLDYVIEARNDGVAGAHDVVIVDNLPPEVQFVSSTEGGVYNSISRQVVWKVGSIPPGSRRTVSVRVSVMWGLPGHSFVVNTVSIPEDYSEVPTDPSGQISYQTVEATEDHVLVTADVSSQFGSGPIGFAADFERVPDMVEPTLEFTEVSGQVTVQFEYSVPIASADLISTTVSTTLEAIDGAKTVREAHDRFQAAQNEQELLDCLRDKNLISQADHKDFSDSSKAQAIARFIPKVVTRAPFLGSLYGEGAGAALDGVNQITKLKWDQALQIHSGLTLEMAERECLEDASHAVSHQSSEVITARDPNAKHVDREVALAGETLNFIVEFENEGAGRAFGVYVTDTLDTDLDDSTLAVGSGASYDPATRTITWFIGEVGPGEGGSLSLSANVRADAPPGTEVTNAATVYFPSVPEATPTNAVSVVVTSPEADFDADGISDTLDNCPRAPNPDQVESDGDGLGNACDADDDGDGVSDGEDACSAENSAGFDADNDGCIDRIEGLAGFIDTLLAEGAIDSNMANSLHAKIDAATASQTRDNICAMVNQLEALKNQIEAQTRKKISEDVAPTLTQYVTNVQNYVLIVTGVGSC